jgi:hypothetical protein
MLMAAHAAEINLNPPGPSDTNGLVIVEGEIKAGDETVFERKTENLTGKWLVVLTSPGGAVIPAMQIGESIHKHDWGTLVPKSCYSACVLIWIAGPDRWIVPGAEVGFHAAAVDGKETGAGNALVGSYLTRWGYGYDVVYWATRSNPNDMAILTSDKAGELGIDLKLLKVGNNAASAPAPAPPAPAPTTPPPSGEQRYFTFASSGTWSGTSPDGGPTEGKIEDVLLVADAIDLTVTKDLRGADEDHRWTYELASWNNSSIVVTGDDYHGEINSKRVWTFTQDYMVKPGGASRSARASPENSPIP